MLLTHRYMLQVDYRTNLVSRSPQKQALSLEREREQAASTPILLWNDASSNEEAKDRSQPHH